MLLHVLKTNITIAQLNNVPHVTMGQPVRRPHPTSVLVTTVDGLVLIVPYGIVVKTNIGTRAVLVVPHVPMMGQLPTGLPHVIVPTVDIGM